MQIFINKCYDIFVNGLGEHIEIKVLTNDYIEELVKFKIDQQKEMHDDVNKEELETLENAERIFLIKHLNNDLTMYGLFFDEELCAVSGMQIFETSPGAMNINGLMAYICNVYTKPQFRRQGYQNQLLDYCIDIAQKKQIGIALLGSTNPIALELYKKHGFQVRDIVLTKLIPTIKKIYTP